MIKKTITFKDLNGNDLTEDFYFALSTAEITELVVLDNDLMSFFEKISKMEEGEELKLDGTQVMSVFKKFIELSVGKRSDDQRRFIKNDEVRDDFMQTDAYSVLFVELCTDTSKASEFVNGIVPSNLSDIVAQMEKSNAANDSQPVTNVDIVDAEPSWITEGRLPTDEELKRATPAQIQLAFQRKMTLPAPSELPQ